MKHINIYIYLNMHIYVHVHKYMHVHIDYVQYYHSKVWSFFERKFIILFSKDGFNRYKVKVKTLNIVIQG